MPRLLFTALALALAAPAAAQNAEPVDLQFDYAGFPKPVQELEPVRALLLDARSESAYRRGHIKGAVNLLFSDSTEATLRAVIGKHPDRPIHICCKNNFTDNRVPAVTKRIDMPLDISTFVNLLGYGYANVWELVDPVSTEQLGKDWVSAP